MEYKHYKFEYNPEIDFWKWIFSLLIVFSHGIFLADTSAGEKLIFGHALIGVEFYSIVSGYFLVQSAIIKDQDVLLYIKNKIVKMFSFFLPAFLFCFIMWVFGYLHNHTNVSSWELFNVSMKGIWEFLFFSSSGISTAGINGTWWYISAMIFGEWLLYPIIKYKEKIYISWIIPLGIFLIIGFMSFSYGSIANGGFAGFIKIDNLRMLLGLLTGGAIFYTTQFLKLINFKLWVKAFLSIIQVFGFIYIFLLAYKNVYGISDYVDTQLDFITFPVYFVSICIIMSKQNIFNIFFSKNPKFYKFLGKLSLCLYLVHWRCLDLVNYILPHGSYKIKLIFFFFFSVLIANIVYVIGTAISKSNIKKIILAIILK